MTALLGVLGELTLALTLLNGQFIPIEQKDPMTLWLEALEQCESGGKSDIKVLDVNDKYSYGSLQFQAHTFTRYAKRYGFFPETFTDEQILENIYDRHTQFTLARNMIADRYENYLAWTNCTTKLGVGLPPESI